MHAWLKPVTPEQSLLIFNLELVWSCIATRSEHGYSEYFQEHAEVITRSGKEATWRRSEQVGASGRSQHVQNLAFPSMPEVWNRCM